MIEFEKYNWFSNDRNNLYEVVAELQETVQRLQLEITELRNKPMIVINNPPVTYPSKEVISHYDPECLPFHGGIDL